MADQTESSIVINASPAAIMDVIADLPAYPEWSDGIKEVTVLALYEDDNRPADARFNLASGAIKDIYELEYDWDGDRRSRGPSPRATCSRRWTASTSWSTTATAAPR